VRFTWDEAKRRSNLAKHGLDFLRVTQLFDGRPVFTYSSPRGDEARVVSIGELAGHLMAVVWLVREDSIRLISARGARDGENRKYRKRYG